MSPTALAKLIGEAQICTVDMSKKKKMRFHMSNMGKMTYKNLANLFINAVQLSLMLGNDNTSK